LIGVNPPPHCQSILDIMPGRSREESWWSQRRDLQTLLQKFSRSAASDPRDNIYALLGLSSDACDNDLLRADYSKPVRTVINDAALFLLRCPELYDTDFLSGYNMPQFLRCVSALGSVALAWAQNTANEPLKSILIARDDLDVNWKDAGGVTLLLTAIRKRDKRTINLLLQRDGIDVNLKDEDGISPLIASVRAQQEDIVKLLLSHHDIDVNSRDTTEKTPLMLATENHEPVVVKSLLGCDGIDVNSKDSNGDTALHLAADFRVSAKNYTSIEFRSKEMAQNTEVARLILGCKDINVGMKNKMEETPLMLAVKNWNMEVVELLDVNSKNKYRRTALLTAVQKSVKSVRVFWRTVIQISGWK
jgi:ankyrin repeat protein